MRPVRRWPVGTGWDDETAREIRSALAPLARPFAPLAKPLRKRDTTWVEPRFEAEITYADIADDGMVRHEGPCGQARSSSVWGGSAEVDPRLGSYWPLAERAQPIPPTGRPTPHPLLRDMNGLQWHSRLQC